MGQELDPVAQNHFSYGIFDILFLLFCFEKDGDNRQGEGNEVNLDALPAIGSLPHFLDAMFPLRKGCDNGTTFESLSLSLSLSPLFFCGLGGFVDFCLLRFGFRSGKQNLLFSSHEQHEIASVVEVA